MRKYGLIISLVIALTFTGCVITIVKKQKKETDTEVRIAPIKRVVVKKN